MRGEVRGRSANSWAGHDVSAGVPCFAEAPSLCSGGETGWQTGRRGGSTCGSDARDGSAWAAAALDGVAGALDWRTFLAAARIAPGGRLPRRALIAYRARKSHGLALLPTRALRLVPPQRPIGSTVSPSLHRHRPPPSSRLRLCIIRAICSVTPARRLFSLPAPYLHLHSALLPGATISSPTCIQPITASR